MSIKRLGSIGACAALGIAAFAAPLASTSAASASTPVPRKANNCFQNGWWTYHVEGVDTSGRIKFTVHGTGPSAKHMDAKYHSSDFVTNGEMFGRLNGPCGENFAGRFEDLSTPFNEGPVTARFNRSSKSFSGKFYTHDGCNRVTNLISKCIYRWWGEKG